MKEIIELNDRLLADAKEHLQEDGWSIERGEKPVELNILPDALRRETCALLEELDRTVPDDFSYTLDIGTNSPGLRLKYRDGATTGYFKGHNWKNKCSIFDQLKEIDWDGERTEAISASGLFDQVGPMAKNMPVMIAGAKTLQKQSSEQVKAYIKEKRKDDSAVHVLMWDGEEALYDRDFSSMEDFRCELPDIMTHMFQVITIVADGKPLPTKQIDALKSAALKKLEDMPISHAKASGKYEIIMAQLFSQEEGEG